MSEPLEKQKKEINSNSKSPMIPNLSIKPIIKKKMEFKARTLKKYFVKRPKAHCWEFKGSSSRGDNIKTMRKFTSAVRSSKNVQKLIVDYPQPSQADWTEIRYSSGRYGKDHSRNSLLNYLCQSLKGQKSIQKISFDFQGFWADRGFNEMGLYLLRRGLKNLISLKSMKLDCTKHPDITKNKGQKFSHVLKTLGFLQDISLNFYTNKELSDKGIENLAQDLKRLHSLQNIDLQFPNCRNLNGAGFKNFGPTLSALTQLQTINLDFTSCYEITDEGVSCIGQSMKALTSLLNLKLKFMGSPEITDKGVSDLAKGIQELPLLKSLDLNFWVLEALTNVDFAFEKLSSLQSLKLVFFACRNLVDICFLEPQQGLTSLRKIDCRFVECHGLTDAVLDRFGTEFASLQNIYLSFYNCKKFTDQGMEDFSKNLRTLASLTNLVLRFEECDGFTDTGLFLLSSGLEGLGSLKDLKLNISGSRFTPEGINHLTESWTQLPLEKINLQFSQSALNDAVIEELGGSLNKITSLKSVVVEIGQGENVTKAGQNSFFQALSGHQCLKSTELKTSHPDDMED